MGQDLKSVNSFWMAELQSYRICKLDYSFYGQCTKSILYILEVLWLHCYMQTMWPFMRHQWTDCNCFWINVSLTSFLPFPKFFYPTFFKIRPYISISLKIWHFAVQKGWNDSVRSGMTRRTHGSPVKSQSGPVESSTVSPVQAYFESWKAS